MGASDRVVVNSQFTKSVAARVWPSLAATLGVIYPCVGVVETLSPEEVGEKPLWDGRFKILLSINRFERKKDIGLAIRSYSNLTHGAREGTRLIIAGGYDSRVTENRQYHEELVALAESFGLSTATAKTVPTALGVPNNIQVLFLLSVPGAFKTTLLENAKLLLYTPANEHFGIVPVEAMQHGLPVLASNTGGPLETIIEGETGWLRDVSETKNWSAVMERVLNELNPTELEQLAQRGKQRVRQHFTRDIMAQKFNDEISLMLRNKRSVFLERKDIVLGIGLLMALVAALLATVIKIRFGRGDQRASAFVHAQRIHPERTDEAKIVPG